MNKNKFIRVKKGYLRLLNASGVKSNMERNIVMHVTEKEARNVLFSRRFNANIVYWIIPVMLFCVGLLFIFLKVFHVNKDWSAGFATIPLGIYFIIVYVKLIRADLATKKMNLENL